MEQCYQTCLPIFVPIRPFLGTPHEMGLLTPKTAIIAPLAMHWAHVDTKMAQKGVNMFNIRGADIQIVFSSVLDHFTQYGQFFALPEGQNGALRVKMPLLWGVPEKA